LQEARRYRGVDREVLMSGRWAVVLVVSGVLGGCAPPADDDDSAAPVGAMNSTDPAELGPAVVCASPLEGFDRLEPIAAELGVVRPVDGPVTLGLAKSGVVARDLDGDGDIDLSFGAAFGDVPIWANDGAGGFERATSPEPSSELLLRHAAVDLTGDGLPELIFVGDGRVAWRENLGELRWGPERVVWEGPAGHLAMAMSLGDPDGDGDLDLAMPGLRAEDPGGARDRVLRNDDLEFTPVEVWPDGPGKPMSVVALWTDRDGDGDADLFLASHRDVVATPPNAFFRNDGPVGPWVSLVDDAAEVGFAMVSSPMGIDVADLNGDSVLDYCFSDTGAVRCLLSAGTAWVQAQQELGIAPPVEPAGDWSGWSVELVDVDVDGLLDLAVVAAFADISASSWPAQPDGLWQGGAGGFVERGGAVGFDDPGARYGLVAADLFGDGFPELITAGLDGVEIWNNPCGAGHWLDLKLVGPAPNVDAFGARVEAWAGDVHVVRELHSSRGASQGPARIHLGLGAAAAVDRLEIAWPGGHRSTLGHVPADRSLTVRHPDARR
jgi:hypothetical protein